MIYGRIPNLITFAKKSKRDYLHLETKIVFMIKNSVDLFKGLNNFFDSQKSKQLTLSGVTIHPNIKDGNYFCCYINKRRYWLEFSKRRRNNQTKSFIHLYDEFKKEHSVVQLTIDNSNFSIESGKFLLIQNRGTTIGRAIS